jgi:hypothetical protein
MYRTGISIRDHSDANDSLLCWMVFPPWRPFLVRRHPKYKCPILSSDDDLIWQNNAQDFAAYTDSLTSALISVVRPYLLKGDLHTLASIPIIPTSRRAWMHIQAQIDFVCCMMRSKQN